MALTLVLACIVIYAYSLIVMNSFGKYVIDPDSFENGVRHERTCSNLVGCFSNIL